MKYVFVNLKRFDIPRDKGGVCIEQSPVQWIQQIMKQSASITNVKLVYFLPEALILSAEQVRPSSICIGSQSVYRNDILVGGNFGAFTSQLPATAAKHYGCSWTIIGHSEERKDKGNQILNEEIKCANKAGLKVLYCVGEKIEERARAHEVIRNQILEGLEGVIGDTAIAYEPVWAIGPGKTPPDKDYIDKMTEFIKSVVQDHFHNSPLVVYGGGLKEDNARDIGSLGSVDGGLVALTRFTGDIGFYTSDLKKIVDDFVGVEHED